MKMRLKILRIGALALWLTAPVTRGGVAFTELVNFDDATSGASPLALSKGQDKFLYGTTDSGGVFRLSTNGLLKTLHSNPRPASPQGVIQARDGNLYGATQRGGAFDL